MSILPNNKVSRETLVIIDNNTIKLDGETYIRRDSKKNTFSSSHSNSSNSNRNKPKSNTSPQSSPLTTAKPMVIKHVNSAEEFPVMYANLIGLPFDFRESNLSCIKTYCNNNGYTYTGKDSERLKYIKVSNPVTEIFGQNFEVQIYESNGFAYNNGKHVRMSVEWYSRPYSSSKKLNSDFIKFTAEIEKAGGMFAGYDETCHRSIYHFPNGVKIMTKAWDDTEKTIQMFVTIP